MDSPKGRNSLWSALDPYAQLVTALLPRAAGVAAFDAAGELRWTNESSSSPDLPPVVLQSLQRVSANTDQAGELVAVHGDTPTYLFWLRDDSGALISVLAILWRTGDSDQRSFSFVHALVKPALECLRRELLARASINNLSLALNAADRDLEVLLSASTDSDGDTGDNSDDLKSILQNATDHLRCSFTALIVPEKSLVVLRTADGLPADTTALARTHRHLISLAQMRREPVILNKFPHQPGTPPLPYRVLSCPVRHPSGRASGVLALFRAADAPEFVEREARLADLLARRAGAIIEASYDAITGLLTRPAFEQRARAVLAEAPRNERKWSGLYIDTDQMHVVNDNFGMHVGDKLIAKLGELIRARLVPGAFAARISGDRFAILLPSAAEDAVKFAESLREGAAAINGATLGADADSSLTVSLSIGVAAILDPRVEFAHAFAVAETACKAAKDRGRNRVELYQASDVSIVRRYEDINIAPNLRLAITENRLRLDAQMILPLSSLAGSRPHFELLLRMIDDDGNTVGPDRFLSAAVRYQLMPTVDRWVIQQAVDLLKPHAELLADRPVVFTINFSGQSLSDPDFPDFVVQQIKSSGLNPAVFCFELTESAAVANLAKAQALIERLHGLGCAVALDDFGTGLSSLSYLRQVPVDILKIDGSFVRDILKDPRADSMVEAIAHLARAMKLTTVAEYVETDEIRIRVAALGVDYGQGFAIARPSPLLDLLQELPMYATARSVDCTARDVLLPPDPDVDMLAGITIEVPIADDASTVKAATPSESAITRYASRA